MDKKHIAILTGGDSSERDVALQSAQTIKSAIEERYDVRLFDFPRELDQFFHDRDWVDVAVPVFHGRGGEDGTVQGLLRTLGVPFIFSDVTAHAIGMNKQLTKDIVSQADIPTPTSQLLCRGGKCNLSVPVVVKPVDGGSSIGISVVKSEDALEQALEQAFKEADIVLIEAFVDGPEYSVAVIDENESPIVLPVAQIKPKNTFFDFESKYEDGGFELLCPAPISDELATRLQAQAVRVHELLGAKDLTRSDFIVDHLGNPWFLEINTIPGATLHSIVPQIITASGRSFEKVLCEWIENTANRGDS